jgi:hypothetical protein
MMGRDRRMRNLRADDHARPDCRRTTQLTRATRLFEKRAGNPDMRTTADRGSSPASQASSKSGELLRQNGAPCQASHSRSWRRPCASECPVTAGAQKPRARGGRSRSPYTTTNPEQHPEWQPAEPPLACEDLCPQRMNDSRPIPSSRAPNLHRRNASAYEY